MRIGILTHPQAINYGGILQCYALYTQLLKMGHEPIVIRREADRKLFLWEWVRTLLKVLHFPRYYTHNNEVDKAINIRPFVEKYLNRTIPISSQRQMLCVCRKYNLEVVIVGSDQVWRRDYAKNFGYNYFLDFVPSSVKKLSYAASFGLSEWQYNRQETERIKKLLLKYSGVSVRESEAVGLLKNNVQIDARQDVDPTLLLDNYDYSEITSHRLINEDYIFVYWLGKKEKIIQKINSMEKKGKRVITVFLQDEKEQVPVEDWLSYVKYASFIVTDSFHGCLFSIIFKRQFEVLENDSGGKGRIVSVCEMLGIDPNGHKDYSFVEQRLSIVKRQSLNYLINSLS